MRLNGGYYSRDYSQLSSSHEQVQSAYSAFEDLKMMFQKHEAGEWSYTTLLKHVTETKLLCT